MNTRGYFLLELVLSVGISLVIVQSLMGSFESVFHWFYQGKQQMSYETELIYVETFIRESMLGASEVGFDDGVSFKKKDVTYKLYVHDHTLKVKVNQSLVRFLTKDLDVLEIKLAFQPGYYEVGVETEFETTTMNIRAY